ncbi:unnamed protein product [Rotaria sp. Silwood2]|nr:unnamed protein product [Rotaria sp. Silwood2]CAF2685915.1 unnamed protein product [Rotaria sp. Silwood2]CAF2949410.1 unnamed protein product [Rotaria sp. Silwood2]CAF3094097.1 unnamed protein product [Rotaria sp. Silwood2]CAF4278096.1 unnamed protein product [Rotaria sp. Silwood2]
MEKLRQCLLRSVTKQSDLIEIFSAIDQDHSGRITFEEFRAAIKALRLGINNDDEIKQLFHQFDLTKNGQIDLSEFLQQLRPPMNERRQRAALNVFNSMDLDKDGTLTITDLKALHNFLNKFDTRGQEDGIINKEEFLGFCSMLSATVKDDVYFEHVLRSLFDFHF